MRRIIEYFVRKRNGAFTWNDKLSLADLFEFGRLQAGNLLRGCRVLLHVRKPRMMLRGTGVKIYGLSRFRWGYYLKLGDHVYINAWGAGGIDLGKKVGIGAFSRLVVSGDLTRPGKGIRIGDHVGIGEFAYLGGAGGLEIGDHTIAGQYLSCHPENHVSEDTGQPVRLQGLSRKGIKIGSNCWIGSKVTVLDGATIGNNCIIAAGAVVTHSFPDNCLIGGVPARILKILRQDQEKMAFSSVTNLGRAI